MKLPLRLSLDSTKSETDGTDEFYYTQAVEDGFEGEVFNICLKAPNAGNTHDGEIGIHRMREFTPLDYTTALGDRDGMRIGGHFPVHSGERIYAKITGTEVDGDVELTAVGYAWPAEREEPGRPESP